MATCMECLSASLYTATERTPIFLAVRMTRHAISPRLAISTFSILPTDGQSKKAPLDNKLNDSHHIKAVVLELKYNCEIMVDFIC